MKLVLRSQCAIAAFVLVLGAFSLAHAQTPSATPDPVAAQLTSSPGGFYSYASDISANGRFVVFESIGDVATEKIPSRNPDGTLNPNARNNEDGNREIFLADYAQRRIFQLTNTKNIAKPTPTPSPTPTPTATPTPTPGATPTPTPTPVPPDLSLVKIEISNNHPMISLEPALVGGRRTYTIVFSSNAPNPGNFDGVETAALTADPNNGWNQEVWIYQLPDTDDTFDLTSGDDIPFANLAGGIFRQITNTPPSIPFRPGIFPPDVVDDNREQTISDDGNTIAFISTRDLVPAVGNADRNPELFLCRTIGGFAAGTNNFVQGTNTQDLFITPRTFNRTQANPTLSFNGNVVAFISTADLAGSNNDVNGHGNEEVYVADFTGSALSNIRQITKTKTETSGPNSGITTNLLSPGRRLSRDGKFVTYESRAEDPVANNGTNKSFLAMFVSDVPANATINPTPKIVGLRAPETSTVGDVTHYPSFTDYDSSLSPHSVVFASALNFKPDGTFPAAADDSTGLNPVPSGTVRPNQIFSTQVPITSTNTFTRLSKMPVLGFVVAIRPIVSSTRQRLTFNLQFVELGGGNGTGDGSPEVFYLLTPPVTSQSSAPLSFFTFPTDRGPMASADPSASPTPTPAPSPSPGEPAGLAPGEWSAVRSTAPLANSDKNGVGGPEAERSPILPIELNGVSVSVNGAAAGIYFVGDSPAEGIHFVVPIGVSTGVATVVINNRGTVFRGFVQIVASQPDIIAIPMGPGGVAQACNITNSNTSGMGCIMGPFKVTSADSTGTLVPTVLELHLTGVRFALPSETKVSFVNGTTTTDVSASSVRPNTRMFGEDLITITLPSSLAGMAPIDYKVIVTVTKSGGIFTSRPAATAPTITIIP